jgi:hypothetical protein
MHTAIQFRMFPSLYRNIKIKIYGTKMVLVILYGCETWPFTLTEEHRLRVNKKRVLRKISGPEWEDVTRDWRKLHNEELRDWCISPNIVKVIYQGEKCIQGSRGRT